MRTIVLLGGLSVLSLAGLRGQEISSINTGADIPAASPQPDDFGFKERLNWAARTAVSPRRLAGYAISSAIQTATNSPREYGPHWDGYGKRIGLRMTTGATGLLMEGMIGGLWNEDPRYYRAEGQSVKARLLNVLKLTVMARNLDGDLVPAYARYISVPANSFLTNQWRPDSHATMSRGAIRIPLSFVDRIIANSFSEFGPDLMRPLRKHKN